MRNWKLIRSVLFSCVAAMLLGSAIACNTVEGAGEDVEKAGEKMQDSAKDAK